MSEGRSSFRDMEVFLAVPAVIALCATAVCLIFVASLFSGSNHQTQTRGGPQELGGMDEGDFHSGRYGYSPNTAYPETQYGSMFDERGDWSEADR